MVTLLQLKEMEYTSGKEKVHLIIFDDYSIPCVEHRFSSFYIFSQVRILLTEVSNT